MNKKICFQTGMMIVSTFLLLSKPLYAVEFGFNPRLSTGIMYYSIDIAAVSKTIPAIPGQSSGQNKGQDKIEFSDFMSFAGYGATFFFNRFFIDLSGQSVFDGSDNTQALLAEYSEKVEGFDSGVFLTAEPEYHAQFDRTDQAVSVGYAVTGGFSVFAGYKWAEIELDTTFEGPVSFLVIDQYVLSGRINGKQQNQFKYEGPFIGVTHGWEIEHSHYLKGLISANLGLAYLKSKFTRNEEAVMRFDSLNSSEIEPMIAPYTENNEVKGDTLGVTLGFAWRGDTPIKNLSYSIVMSGYRYQFDSDDADYSDITETAVTFKVGLTYAF